MHDPYTNRDITFNRDEGTDVLVQIDHVVALLDAWQTGAQQWDQAKRTRLANDPLDLLAVDGKANRKKKASNVASWLPSNKDFRCDYVTRVEKPPRTGPPCDVTILRSGILCSAGFTAGADLLRTRCERPGESEAVRRGVLAEL